MVEIPNIVKKKIDVFLYELSKNHYNIDRAILFGSYANGTFNEWSDIDLAIVSDDFSGDSFEDKCRIRTIKLKSGLDLSPMPFRNEDFINSIFARDEILGKGIILI